MWEVKVSEQLDPADDRWYLTRVVGGVTKFYPLDQNPWSYAQWRQNMFRSHAEAQLVCDQLNIRDYGACESETVVGSKQ